MDNRLGKIAVFAVGLLFITIVANAQQMTVSGTVTDAESNEGLPGVNILVKGTNTGTSTDSKGYYEVNVASLQDTLRFSFVGYQTQLVPVNDRTEIDIALQSQAISGQQLVVVGYGEQKKENLTGSVSSITSDQLEKRDVTQSSQLLQGVASGVTAIQGSGEPGNDGTSIVIRGLGTFSGAGNNPLVIVDGIPGSMNSVNPNNIKSVTVLKDAASSAIYGSRGANGVILVTTKEGDNNKLQVTYDTYIAKTQATELPQYVDSWVYANMVNEAQNNQGLGDKYTQEEIQKYKSGDYPDQYPNINHAQDLFKSGNSFQMKHNLTFSGGNDNTQYLFSAGYLGQNGIIKKINYNQYNLRVNLNSDLGNNLLLNTKSYAVFSNRDEPGMLFENSIGGLDAIRRAATTFPATVPGEKADGTYGTYMGHPTAEAGLDGPSFGKTNDTHIVNNVSLEWNILNSLQIKGRIGYTWDYSKAQDFGAAYSWGDFGQSKLNVNTFENKDLILESIVNYDKTFDSHHFHLLGGYSQESINYSSLGAYRENFPSTQLHVLDAASTTSDENSGTASTINLRSLFGRLNYSFQNKYLLEGDIRYDGSSRFSKGNRYGLFPSVSAGWVISNEKFFNIPWIENLKIRGSYGTLGNQQIGTYPYQQVLNLNQPYPVGQTEALQPGVALTTLPFNNITWETTKNINVGLDLTLFDGKLGFTVDHYLKKTNDILYHLTVSDVLGMGVSEQNAGKVENEGWNFELTHKNTIGDFSYSIHPIFSINHNEVLSLAGIDKDISQGLFLGESLSSIYGYQTDGLFIDQKDIDGYAEQPFDTKPGYPRYKDISGPDGKPDGKVTPQYDRTIIGNAFPKYSYGLSLTANYKGFNFYALLQGQGGLKDQINGTQLALYNNGNVQQWQIDNRWTQENPNPNADYPRLEYISSSSNAPPWGDNLTYWLRDASFLRIKNIQIGYTIPQRLIKNMFINDLRVYISAQNLRTFDHYYPGWDPEMTTGGYAGSSYYPPTSQWTLGMKVNF